MRSMWEVSIITQTEEQFTNGGCDWTHFYTAFIGEHLSEFRTSYVIDDELIESEDIKISGRHNVTGEYGEFLATKG